MAQNIIENPSISDIPKEILVKILEKLELLDKHEAGMVSRHWFDAIYENPRNLDVLSIIFGNVSLDDLEPPLSYFLQSSIPYKRMVLGAGIHLGTVNKFLSKIGETLEELVIKQFNLKKKYEKFSLSAGRVAEILASMKNLKSLELNWSYQNEFMLGNTVFQRNDSEKVLKALKNVKEFRLIARDVTAEQFLSLVMPMKNLESLFVDIRYTMTFYQQDKHCDWATILQVVKRHCNTLRHLFLNLCAIDSQQELPVSKKEFLTQLQKIRVLQLESLSVNLTHDLAPSFLHHFFLKFEDCFTTLGPVPKNDNIQLPMEITASNLSVLVQTLPRLRFINVKVNRPLKDLTIFQQLKDLQSLNLYVHAFDRNHHLLHRNSHDLPFKKPAINPHLRQLTLNGNMDHYTHRDTCIKCILYMVTIFPNLTRLELSVNIDEGLNDQSMRLIFHHLTNLEVLGVNSCKQVTDDAFTGTFTKVEGCNAFKKRKDSFSISNLKRLHTILLFPLERMTDTAFIEGFAKIPTLKSIAMTGMEEITSAGIEALADGCPNLEVIYFENCTQMDERFVKFLVSRMIHLKYLRLNGSHHFPEEIVKINGVELLTDRISGEKSVIWRAHNAYKCGTGQFPFQALNLQL